MKFGNTVRVGTFDIDEDHDDAEARFLQLSIRLRYYYYVQLVATRRDWMRVPNLKIWGGSFRGRILGSESSRQTFQLLKAPPKLSTLGQPL